MLENLIFVAVEAGTDESSLRPVIRAVDAPQPFVDLVSGRTSSVRTSQVRPGNPLVSLDPLRCEIPVVCQIKTEGGKSALLVRSATRRTQQKIYGFSK